MSKLVGILILLGIALAPAAAQGDIIGRLYFDLLGNDGSESGPRLGPTAKVNPELPNGGGRLFIYWEFGHTDQLILGLGVDIEIIDGLITEAFYYNPEIPLSPPLDRWNQAVPNPAQNPNVDRIPFQAANVNQAGLRNADGFPDNQFDPTDGPFGSTLLGYVDVVNDADQFADIRFHGNNFGIAERGGHPGDTVLFGFGDPLDPHARIIPEPGGLMLIGLGALALSRRR